MPESILYLLKANLAIVLFYLGYRLLLRRLTFYTLNRFYLLFALLFSFTYPLADLSWLVETPVRELPGEVVYILPDWEQVPATAFNGWPLLVALVGLGAVWFAIRLLIRLLSLRRIHRQSRAATWHWFSYRQVFAPIRPFSFWRNIYVNVERHADGELKEIFRHEQVHVSGLHTVDVLLAELGSVLCWFNPGVWLLRHAVRENLEFITDRNVLRSGVDKQTYQYSLLGVGGQLEAYPAIAQGFNFKNLKTRIMMMNKKRSSRLQLGRYLLAVPVIAVFVLFFTMSRAAYPPVIGDAGNIPESLENPLRIELIPDAGEQRGNPLPPDTMQRPDELKGKVMGVRLVDREEEPTRRDTIKLRQDTVKSTRDTSIIRIVRVHPDDKGSPLMVLDGKALEEGFDINTINPNTIESITVLKDASATSLYGSRGDKGVVLITTKAKARRDAAITDTTALQEIRVIGYGKKDVPKKEEPSADNDFNGALVVIDGKESTAAALRKLSADDIKAINVLKGPSATDKYGDKGSKGAIEVSTAKGK
ncbi:M56 family metallopeptidase [Parapedobacter sp. 2B3]|uniref:M56 family metallopeptidase n=1 Tax=Parapedobacter sp. 2B3 TaxID=3342381 RepID=UPI0035B62569